MVMRNTYVAAEHRFAQFVRILGKGKQSSRSLTQDEARDAMTLILNGEVEDVQLGAFLMLLRVKEESAEELAGFVQAARAVIQQQRDEQLAAAAVTLPTVHIDWSSYAGKRKHYPWFLLAVKCLTQVGVRVFMHGACGHTVNRLYTEQVLPLLGLPHAQNWADAADALNREGFAYLSLSQLNPRLGEIMNLRQLFGLRSPVHTLARLLNPCDANLVMQAIFHPAYRESHQHAAHLLGYPNSCVIKGEGGEIERNPDGLCLAKRIIATQLHDDTWPMLFEQRHAPEEAFDIDEYLAVWRAERQHEYGEMAVISTLALALRCLHPSYEQAEALAQAELIWQQRQQPQPLADRWRLSSPRG